MSSKFQNDAIFWVEVEKIKPNPYQPRRDFNQERLRDLAESIRQYGVLQPLTVTRREQVKEDGGLKVEYELIAGERRHRASQMANLSQVPVIIRSGQEDAQVKLELAIIENLQREDLNPIERAEAFDQLANEFGFTHKEVAEKIGKSREYVSNSMRLLKLPEEIKQAIIAGKMTEGHARPIMMLRDKPEEQEMLFKEVVHKGLTVREAESIARRDAQDKVRKKKNKIDPETKALEDRLSDTFGTRVKIEERDVGGKLVIDFFSEEDLENIIKLVQAGGDMEMGDMMEQYVQTVAAQKSEEARQGETVEDTAESVASEKKEEKSSDTSMAETLGTMIAAARAQQTDSKNTPEPEKQQSSEEAEALQTGFVNQRSGEVETAETVSTDSDISDKKINTREPDSVPTRQTPDLNHRLAGHDSNPEAEESPDNNPVEMETVSMDTEPPTQPTAKQAVSGAGEASEPAQPEAQKTAFGAQNDEVSEQEEALASPPVGEGEMDTEANEETKVASDDKDEDEMYAVSNFSI